MRNGLYDSYLRTAALTSGNCNVGIVYTVLMESGWQSFFLGFFGKKLYHVQTQLVVERELMSNALSDQRR